MGIRHRDRLTGREPTLYVVSRLNRFPVVQRFDSNS